MRLQMKDEKGRTEVFDKDGIMVLRLKNWEEVSDKVCGLSKSTFQREKKKLVEFFKFYLHLAYEVVELRILMTGYIAGREQDDILRQMIEWIKS